MAHLSRDLVDRVVRGQASEAEVERLYQHAWVCTSCRTLVATSFEAAGRTSPKGEGLTLPALLQVADSERERAVETVLATAELSALGRLSRKAQQERVLEAKACHSLPFVDQLLAQLRSAGTGDEAEFLASLAVLALTQMDETRLGPLREDFQAHAWIEAGNARRREARWRRAETALAQAERLLAKGTGDPLVEARLLSVKASLRSDQGQRSEALRLLLRCKKLYVKAEAWPEVARTLVKEADAVYEAEPARALEALSLALPLIRDEEVLLYAEILRVWCYLGVDRLPSALRVFIRRQPRWAAHPKRRIRLRSQFLAGRLLEALNRPLEAVRLFEEVIAEDLNHELYKDAFLDLLYLFGFYFRNGEPQRATAVCKRALGQLEALGLVHEQLRAVWDQLLLAAKDRPLVENLELSEIKEYLRVFWKHPAPHPPKFSSVTADRATSERYVPSPFQVAGPEHERAVETLMAMAEWSALSRLSRKAQQERVVVKSKACRTLAFVNVLLSELRTTPTADDAEFIASLAVQAVNLMAAKYGGLRADLQARAWTEVGNWRRREAKWRRAEMALSRAQRLLVKGTGDPLVEARVLSVTSSLRSEQGRHSEAASILQRCKKLYAQVEEWSLVARTLVKEADAIYEVEPEKALESLSLALPLIDDEEVRLYAEILRGWCYIETHRVSSALQVFSQTQLRWAASPEKRIRLRSRFFAGRLLYVLGKPGEALRLYEEVIAADLRCELYKDAFLDLLFLFGVLIRIGDAEGAIAVCRRALGQMETLDLVHEQLHAVWSQLMEAARIKVLDEKVLREVKEYLRVFWRHPAAQAPNLI